MELIDRRSAVSRLESEVKEREERIRKTETELVSKSAELEKLDEDISNYRKRLNDLDKEINEKNKELKNSFERLSEATPAKEELLSLEATVNLLKEETENKEKIILEKDRELRDLEGMVQKFSTESSHQSATIESLKNDINIVVNEKEEIEKKYHLVVQQLSERESQIQQEQRAKDEQEHVEEQFSSLQAALQESNQKLEEERQKHNKDLKESKEATLRLKTELFQSEKRRNELERHLESYKDSLDRSRSETAKVGLVQHHLMVLMEDNPKGKIVLRLAEEGGGPISIDDLAEWIDVVPVMLIRTLRELASLSIITFDEDQRTATLQRPR